MSDEREKAIMGSQALGLFCKQFGDDVHANILLEVLLEGIMNEESLFILGEQEQGRNKVNHSPQRGFSDNFKNPRSQ